MRFFSVFTSLLAASFAASMATPNVVNKRSLSSGSALTVINSLNQQVAAIKTNVSSSLNGINQFSSPAAKAAAAQKVNQQLAALISGIGQASSNVTKMAAGGGGGATQKRSDTSDLIQAIDALINEIESLTVQALTALGLSSLVTPILQVLGVLNTLIFDIVAVVVDALPFVGPILGAVGSLLSGIGSFIPK